MQYVGKMEQEFRTRVKEHVRYIKNVNVSQATGQHFSQRNHNITDFSIAILEKVETSDTLYIEEREREWIKKFNYKYRGINRVLPKFFLCHLACLWNKFKGSKFLRICFILNILLFLPLFY